MMARKQVSKSPYLHLLHLLIPIVGGVIVLLGSAGYAQIIIDHTCCSLIQVPTEAINQAKADLHVAYEHTSHGSQIPTGMGMVNSLNPGGQYDYSNGGGPGELDFHNDAMRAYSSPYAEDLGDPNRVIWATATRNYLAVHPDVNVIMWSWCTQVSSATIVDITTYLNLMNQLELDYPTVTFIYMTGHLDGTGSAGNLHQRNNQIRDFCLSRGKVLFDFADIERYDPDGIDYLDLGAGAVEGDGCRYNGGSNNWCEDWCSVHGIPDECTTCSSCAHSHCLNCYNKGKAFWWMVARVAGWDGASGISDWRDYQ